MINKFTKLHESIFTKIILTITALSFMSLFGVSSYIGAANSNKTVAKVDDLELSQSEYSYRLQKKLLEFKNLSGMDLEENSDQRNQIANAVLKAEVDDMILQNTMRKYHVDFTENLIRQIIFVTPQFMVNNQFNREMFKTYLQQTGQSESEYVQKVKLNVARRVLLDSQVSFENVPEIAQQMMAKVLGQRRTFKYIKIENATAPITREPSEEELDQYYDDLKDEFMIPETRNISVLYLPESVLLNNIEVSPEEIQAYYKEHEEEVEQPKQRNVLQMAFDAKDKADEAYAKLSSGADFAQTAKEYGQSEEDTSLGFVSQDNLTEELAEVIFALPLNMPSKPQNIADSWQIIKVIGTKDAVVTPKDEAEAKIVAELKQDKIYDDGYEIMTAIEDELGAGAELSAVAEKYGVELRQVTELAEDGTFLVADADLAEVLKNKDVLDVVFSYNEGEAGQSVETDDGIVVVQIDKINETHMMPREDATSKLKEFWLENERAAVVQETLDNIQHDLEAGDDIITVARRYSLPVKNTMPVTRSETFDVLNYEEMRNLFAAAKDEPQIVKTGDDYIVAVTTNVYDDSASLSEDDKLFIKQALYAETVREMENALLQDFAKNYKIEVNYQRAGLGE
ncbi:MAG: SurA N-terminal domain-containing protein [Alphaproteobacteria bacterium]|nr:SurA N-terminal domain-containing protein [Alphaproteobacteria bacterium]